MLTYMETFLTILHLCFLLIPYAFLWLRMQKAEKRKDKFVARLFNLSALAYTPFFLWAYIEMYDPPKRFSLELTIVESILFAFLLLVVLPLVLFLRRYRLKVLQSGNKRYQERYVIFKSVVIAICITFVVIASTAMFLVVYISLTRRYFLPIFAMAKF